MKKSVSIVVGFQVIIAALLQIAKIPRVMSSDYYFCNMYSEYKIFQSRFQLCKISFGFYVGRLRCRHFKEMQNLCQLPFITKDKCGIHVDTNQDQITYYIKLTQIVAAVRTFKKIDAVASNTVLTSYTYIYIQDFRYLCKNMFCYLTCENHLHRNKILLYFMTLSHHHQ